MKVAQVLPDPNSPHQHVGSHVVTDTHVCPQICMYDIAGPLFFGAVQSFENSIMKTIHYKPKVLLLRMGQVPFMDTTGEVYLKNIVRDFQGQGGIVLISEIARQPKELLRKTGLYDIIGEEHLFEHTGEAIEYALRHIDSTRCLGCHYNVFRECQELSCHETFQQNDLGIVWGDNEMQRS
jgi:SulP family sulfate permease